MGAFTEPLIGAAAAFVVALLGYWQWRRSPALQRKFELRRAKAERKAVEKGRPRALAAYREKLLVELRNLKILDMTKPLDLDALYVEVQVREEEPPRYADPAELEVQARGEPERLLRLSQHRFRERTSSPLPPEDALSRFGRIVVLGDPGAGKTTLLKHLAFLYARDESAVPVFVELRKFVDSGCERLLDYVASEWEERYGFEAAAPYLDEALSAGGVALLLDGLDEVLGGATAEAANATYTRVVDEIDRLATRYPTAPIAVTCRRAGWRGSLASFRTLEVLDFSWSQIQTFVAHWFADDVGRAEGLRDALADNLRMQTLAANPLILSLIAIVYERDLELPERRAALYRRCVEVLLKEWDSHRGIARHGAFTTDRKRDLLQEIAWHFHCQGLRYFPKLELLELIEGFLPTINLPPDQAEAILEEICTHYGLLKEQAHDMYGFLHLTLQEYFAAEAANDGGSEALDLVIRHRHNPWWEEVMLLLAGRLSDASPLLLGILGRDTEPPEDEPLAADDDMFRGDLFLAAKCLVGTPRVRAAWLRPRILRELEGLLYDEFVKPEQLRDVAAKLLIQTGGEPAVTRLLAALHEGPWWEDSVAKALGDLRIESAAPALLHHVLSHEPFQVGAGAAALGKLRYQPAIPALVDNALRTWRNPADHYVPHEYMDAIAELGDETDALRILAELLKGDRLKYGVERTVVRLLGPSDPDRLLSAILDDSMHFEHRSRLLGELARSKVLVPVPAVLRAVASEEYPWAIRYLLTDCSFEHDAASCEQLQRILRSDELDERVRIGVAMALAELGQPDGLTLIRGVFEGALEVAGSHWRSESPGDLRVEVWTRAAKALSGLDGEAFLQPLLDRFERSPLGDEDEVDWPLLQVIIDHQPEIAAHRLLEQLTSEPLPDILSNAMYLLPQIMSESMAPEVLAYLMSQGKAVFSNTYAGDLVDRAVRMSADVEAVRWLHKPVLDERDYGERVSFWVESALQAACRTARVRVFQDGRIVPIDS